MTPAPPPAVGVVFGDRTEIAVRYAELLCSVGVDRGLIGPREADRIWERHLLNSAVLGELLPHGGRLLDVGSGAGLPGIPLAVARPDLQVVLLEPMLRRCAFLEEAVGLLGLTNVQVVRGRAEDGAVRRALGRTPQVTARAVAPLGRLAGWCVPLLTPNGQLLAMKGERAREEVAEAADELAAAGLAAEVRDVGAGIIVPTALVVVLRRGGAKGTARAGRPAGVGGSLHDRRGGCGVEASVPSETWPIDTRARHDPVAGMGPWMG